MMQAEQEATPKGKRSVRTNIYGNTVGYVSGKRWKEFGCGSWAEKEAAAWAAGRENEEWWNDDEKGAK